MPDLTLYTTSCCHLCEQAQSLLYGVLGDRYQDQVREIDIADDDALMARYGIRIPVLALTASSVDGAELGWPFTAADIVDFLDHNA